MYVPMSATKTSTNEEITALFAAFDQAQEPLLIHCSQGINRTGEACALWLLYKGGATKEEALTMFDKKYGYDYVSRPEKYEFIKGYK